MLAAFRRIRIAHARWKLQRLIERARRDPVIIDRAKRRAAAKLGHARRRERITSV